jgi:hypothetical protein
MSRRSRTKGVDCILTQPWILTIYCARVSFRLKMPSIGSSRERQTKVTHRCLWSDPRQFQYKCPSISTDFCWFMTWNVEKLICTYITLTCPVFFHLKNIAFWRIKHIWSREILFVSAWINEYIWVLLVFLDIFMKNYWRISTNILQWMSKLSGNSNFILPAMQIVCRYQSKWSWGNIPVS